MGMNILIIDDDAFLAGIYGRFLNDNGCEVRVARSGEEGLRQMERDVPDLVVLDVLLPEMDGFEVMETVRSHPDIGRLPLVVLSKLGQREDVDRAMECGASAYLIKAHARPQSLLKRIQEILCPATSLASERGFA